MFFNSHRSMFLCQYNFVNIPKFIITNILFYNDRKTNRAVMRLRRPKI